MRRRILAALTAAALAVVLSGCTATALQAQYQEGDGNGGYITGDGTVEVWKASQRTAPIDFSGKTDQGTEFSSKQHRGQVMVVNFWYAGCPPCRLEARSLEKIDKQFQPKGVVFVGVNTRDEVSASRAYDATFGVTYPSVLDADDGTVQLAFSGAKPPNATPTTFVIDKEGRIAARIEGPISQQPSTLISLIRSALREKTGTGASAQSSDAAAATVVSYTRSSCPPCRVQAATVTAVRQGLAAGGVAFVSAAPSREPAAENGGPEVAPETVVLDAAGHTVAHVDGPIAQARLTALVRSALAEGRAS